MARSADRLLQYPLSYRFIAAILAWLLLFSQSPARASAASPENAIRRRVSTATAAWTIGNGGSHQQGAVPPRENAGTKQKADEQAARRMEHDADKLGEIAIAQPKIWQYERVNTLLDGLLRDVEGVSVADLVTLDANTPNGAAVKFVQSMLDVSAKYDQAAALQNGIAQKNYQSMQGIGDAQIQANAAYLQQLYGQRAGISAQLQTAVTTNSGLLNQLAMTTSTGTALTALQSQQTSAAASVTALQNQLNTVNSQITTASTTPAALAAPSVTSTSAPTSPESTTVFSDFLSKLPSGVMAGLIANLQSPSYPATKKLDNFITLLYERLSREISVLQDDLTRDANSLAYLVQFDVGVYPSRLAKNRVARVEFAFDECPDCKVYSIYPGQSSYNMVNYEGTSKRYSLTGAVQTLFGFGINANYRKQEDKLHGDLTQSVYTSGFQDVPQAFNPDHGEGQRFGWYYGTAPFEEYVSPGIRSTFAIVVVPRKLAEKEGGHNLTLHSITNWAPRDNPRSSEAANSPFAYRDYPSMISRYVKVQLPGTEGMRALPRIVSKERDSLHVLSFEYNTVFYDPQKDSKTASTAGGTAVAAVPVTVPIDALTSCPQDQCAGVLIALDDPVDPNLVVTVRGEPLKRVRDWRGRATSILPPVQSQSDIPASPVGTVGAYRSENPPSRSLLEVDQLARNSWIAVDSHRILLNISRDLATDYEFPVIRISDPAKKTLVIPHQLDEAYSEIVTNGFHMVPRTGADLRDFIYHHFVREGDSCEASGAGPGQPALNKACQLNANPFQPGGPYPFETFLPLFLPEPYPKQFYAFLGETGNQLLVGFLPNSAGTSVRKKPSGGTEKFDWRAAHNQIIVEDRDLDLAWSLSCDPQGPELVCDLPQSEMAAAYQMIHDICGGTDENQNNCPAITNKWKDFPFISTLQVWVEQYDPDGENYFYSPAPAPLGLFPVQIDKHHSDPPKGFQPWFLTHADSDLVTLQGCQFGKRFQAGDEFEILGQHIPLKSKYRPLLPIKDDAHQDHNDCWSFDAPTVALTHTEMVLRSSGSSGFETPMALSTGLFRPYFGKPYITATRAETSEHTIQKWDIEIPVGRVDYYDRADFALSKFSAKWQIGGQPAFELLGPTDTPNAKACAPKDTCPSQADWDAASSAGLIRLVLTVDKSDLASLPRSDIHLMRGKERFMIATLPNLWKLLVPSELTLKTLSATQFSLEGPGAGTISAVSIQGPSGAFTLKAASGTDIAVVSVSEQVKTGAAKDGPVISALSPASGAAGSTIVIKGSNFGKKAGTVKIGAVEATPSAPADWEDGAITIVVPKDAVTGIVVVTTAKVDSNGKKFIVAKDTSEVADGPDIKKLTPASGAIGAHVTITGVSFGSVAGTVKIAGSTLAPGVITAWGKDAITFTVPKGAKTGALTVLANGVVSNSKPFTVAASAQQSADSTAAAPSAPGPGTYTVIPLIQPSDSDDALYLAVEVTDEKRKSLTFVIPAVADTTKAAADTAGGETTTTNITKTVKTSGTPAAASAPAAKKPGG